MLILGPLALVLRLFGQGDLLGLRAPKRQSFAHRQADGSHGCRALQPSVLRVHGTHQHGQEDPLLEPSVAGPRGRRGDLRACHASRGELPQPVHRHRVLDVRPDPAIQAQSRPRCPGRAALARRLPHARLRAQACGGLPDPRARRLVHLRHAPAWELRLRAQSVPARAREAACRPRGPGSLRGAQRRRPRLQQLPGPDAAAREAARSRSRSDHRALRLERSLPVRVPAGSGALPGARERAGRRPRGSGAAHGALPVRAAPRVRGARAARAEPRCAARVVCAPDAVGPHRFVARLRRTTCAASSRSGTHAAHGSGCSPRLTTRPLPRRR